MPAQIPSDSVGLVTPERARFEAPFTVQSGQTLPEFELVYETYGELNAARSNAVLIYHALSGHHHAAGYSTMEDQKPGWWDTCIGPGKPLDTNRFFIVSLNNLGGCHGSTGPRSINPETGRVYGPDFPTITVRDWVRSQKLLMENLNIDRWAAVVGGSLGAMQAMQWAIDYPEQLGHAVLIAGAPKLSAQNIAFNEIARQAITTDPDYHGGRYLEAGSNPVRGLMLARMVGHVTYQSDHSWADKFGREIKSGDIERGQEVEFQVESYLHYQGRSFSQHFDANTYVLMTRALDYFDPAREFGDDLVAALRTTACDFMVTAFSTDWRFSPSRSKEIVDALIHAGKSVVSTVIDTPFGHDAFLLPVERYLDVFSAYMDRVARQEGLNNGR